MSILEKIAKANLVGCGGGCFPTARKWQMVKEAKSKNKVKYVVMNASEGSPTFLRTLGFLFIKQKKLSLVLNWRLIFYLKTVPALKALFILILIIIGSMAEKLGKRLLRFFLLRNTRRFRSNYL